jgi:hypothetical protein
MAEFSASQHRRLLEMFSPGPQESDLRPEVRTLRFALDGKAVQGHRVESGVLGRWLTAFQDTITAVANALDDRRTAHDSGPVPKSIQRETRLFTTAVFPSSYGMVLEEERPDAADGIFDFGPEETLLDRAMNLVLNVTDHADKGAGAEEAVITEALPLGNRVFTRLTDLTALLANSGADVKLTWSSPYSGVRVSRLDSENARYSWEALRTALVEEREEMLQGMLIGGSPLRGTIEIKPADHGVVTARVEGEVTPLLTSHVGREVVAQVLVFTARSPHGREHHSYVLRNLELRSD